MIFLTLLLAANAYDPRLIMTGEAVRVEKFAADVRACGYAVTVRDWHDGDVAPPKAVTSAWKAALTDKQIEPNDPRLPCLFDAEKAAFRSIQP